VLDLVLHPLFAVLLFFFLALFSVEKGRCLIPPYAFTNLALFARCFLFVFCFCISGTV
jgi:hypothetical protein